MKETEYFFKLQMTSFFFNCNISQWKEGPQICEATVRKSQR